MAASFRVHRGGSSPVECVAGSLAPRRLGYRPQAAYASAARMARASAGRSGSRAPIRSTVSPGRASPATHATTVGRVPDTERVGQIRGEIAAGEIPGDGAARLEDLCERLAGRAVGL